MKRLTNELLKNLVEEASKNQEGEVASYIPELTKVDTETCAIAIQPIGGETLVYSNKPIGPVTLQSAAKLVPLIGLLEEIGPEKVFEWVHVEPSGDDFASIRHLAQFGPVPSNPMLNSGAITLCSYIPGDYEQQVAWLESWVFKLFGKRLSINPMIFASEKRTGDRNRALAYLLNNQHNLGSSVQDTLDLYFSLCSYQANVDDTVYLPTLIANSGIDPKTQKRIISASTCEITQAIMATCGLYDESGTHMVRCGIPAKSSVSGYILASVPRKAGISVLSPLVNNKGNSIRGSIMLEHLAKKMKWHFAAP